MSGQSADKPGVIAPPPLIYLAAILVGALLERAWRWRVPTERWGALIGISLIVTAVALFRFAVVTFKHARTSPKPHKPTKAIVTSGPFRYTRNPIYIAFTLAHLGIAVWSRSGWILALLVPVLAVVRYGVIAREERYLERKFGNEYVAYRRRVRRWV
jgi:protein-S-isoprenylcysteine O-methyltransferase Ste14